MAKTAQITLRDYRPIIFRGDIHRHAGPWPNVPRGSSFSHLTQEGQTTGNPYDVTVRSLRKELFSCTPHSPPPWSFPRCSSGDTLVAFRGRPVPWSLPLAPGLCLHCHPWARVMRGAHTPAGFQTGTSYLRTCSYIPTLITGCV